MAEIFPSPEIETPAAPVARRGQPVWLYWLIAGLLTAGVLTTAVTLALQSISSSAKLPSALISPIQLIIIALLSVLVGLATYLALRGHLPEPVLWVAMAAAAWFLAFVHAGYPYYYSALQNAATTATEQAYLREISILANVAGFGLFGFACWLVLRLAYQRSAVWILWCIGGIALGFGALVLGVTQGQARGLISPAFTGTPVFALVSNLIVYLGAFVLSGVGLQIILKNPRSALEKEHQRWRRFVALWVLSYLLGIAAYDIIRSTGLLSTLVGLAGSSQAGSYAINGLVNGLALGVAGWLVLRRYYPRPAAWLVATAVGLALGNLAFLLPVGQLIAGQANPSLVVIFLLNLLLQLASALILGIAQMGALAYMGVREAWKWIGVALLAQAASYLFLFFLNQQIGIVLAAAITGVGLAVLARGGFGERWVDRPQALQTGEEALEDDRGILEERLREALWSRPQVLVQDDSLLALPKKRFDPELVEWLLSRRGRAALVDLPEPPQAEAEVSPEAPVVLAEDQFTSVDQEPGPSSETGSLIIRLEESGAHQLAAYLEEHPGAALYLAVDGEIAFPQAARVEENVLVFPAVDDDDAFLFAALLNQPPLSSEYQAELDDEGV